jgi:cytochrome c553
MAAAARRLTDDQIDALAAWYAALPLAKGPG